MSIIGSRRPEPRFVDPSRITTARLRRGLTKTALARELGLMPKTLSKYENDGAPVNRLVDLAEVLHFPESYFLREQAPHLELQDVSFRAGTRVSVKARSAALSSGRHGIELSEWIHAQLKLPARDIPRIENTTPEEAALLLRQEWGLGTKPLPNLVQLCESRGCRMMGLPKMAESVDAFSTWYEAEPYIFLARRRSPEGVRFDIAHELGHLVMHSAGASFEMNSAQEQAADRFASEFLMPATEVAYYLPAVPTVDAIFEVKKYFRVSALAMARKAFTLGRLGEWSHRQTVAELSKRGFRTGEPDGIVGYERSRVFDFLFSAERSRTCSPTSLAQEFSIPLGDIQALTLGSTLGAVEGTGMVESLVQVAAEPRTAPHFRVIEGAGAGK